LTIAAQIGILSFLNSHDTKCAAAIGRSTTVPKSVLEAIKEGFWDFEPREVPANDFDGTDAMPGTRGKLEALAERLRSGLPLWHPDDRDDIEAPRVGKPR
jgi:hypothetical protein